MALSKGPRQRVTWRRETGQRWAGGGLAVDLGAVPPSSVDGSKSKPPAACPVGCTSRGELELDLDLDFRAAETQHKKDCCLLGLSRAAESWSWPVGLATAGDLAIQGLGWISGWVFA
jgi:hypothetical protein